ncbi:hypothetical protein ACHAXT_003159 [Thalassiosira profunda]
MVRPSTAVLGLAVQASFCNSFSATPRPTRHRCLHPPPSALQSQVLDFIEPTTGVPVKLIGSMHYNPASIKLAEDSINALAAEGKLGSIVIESCDIRWNATMENNQMVKEALLSEMKAAHDLGIQYERPVVLGDQRINITVDGLKSGAKEAVLDLVQPWRWGRLFESISSAREEAVPVGPQYLGLESFFDPKLLGAAPVSFVKYPLSYMVKSPVFAGAVALLIILGGVEDSSAFTDTPTTTDIIESLILSALETVIFARVFLKELLADRNVVLAENILEQCRNYEKSESSGSSSWWGSLFGTETSAGGADKSTGAVYAQDSVVGKPEEGKTVVAVLGLAHCNGIKKLLVEGGVEFN